MHQGKDKNQGANEQVIDRAEKAIRLFVLKEDKETILYFSNIAKLLRIAYDFQDKRDYLIIYKRKRFL